jgi:hypothetical protein
MSKFQFTQEQIDNLQKGKPSLGTEKARNWAAEEEKAEVATSAILNDEKFKNGENLTAEKLDELFRLMKWFSANRNLSNLLYRTNGLENFNTQLRNLIHGEQAFPQRVDSFFRMQLIGIQTMSQFLVAADTRKYPFVTSQTKEALAISSEQDENALSDALDVFNIQDKGALLDRTLDYLRDYIIFQTVKNAINLEKYTYVNNFLWFAQEQETGPENVIKSYGSISIEHDLRDFPADNIFVIEKGLTLIKKEYDTSEVKDRSLVQGQKWLPCRC